ncbi:NAD(P)/FAD-dependent oxidoreductase [Parapedobacter sp. 2B3]|uniref:NAD(P)/FAD-dependent oxidoreductase n=1 Tax=Parapedobacter sp. 2B3 TaxID=3342381 RepID=UPI0035B66847
METKYIAKKHLVLVGGGFAGLNFARRLSGNRFYNVTLVDSNNYNYFTPLLYQVATGFLEPAAISYPFRKLLKDTGMAFRMATVIGVDADKQAVYLSDGGQLDYDVLVLAAGSKTNFFGNAQIERNAFYIKTIDDALSMRNGLIQTMEKAAVENNPEVRRKLLTMVVAGGGPTGVELAGMLAEFKQCLLGMDYPELKNETLRVFLVEGSPHLLAPMSTATHKEAYRVLNRLGIAIRLNTRVTHYEDDRVHLSNGEVIEAKTLIWAIGVTANTVAGVDGKSVGRGGRMMTDPYGRVMGYDNIYAIGDISIQQHDKAYPDGHPQLAQPAIQQGKRLASNLLLLAGNKPMKPFSYADRGDMAIIGRRWAVADLFKHRLHLGGVLGLLGWLFIHLISLVNYNNKIKTFYNWLVAYLTHDQVLRMIFRGGNGDTGRASGPVATVPTETVAVNK